MDGLAALADPTRRRIVELLAEGEESAGRLAGRFAISQPAVSRHLRVLREVGLVRVRPVGQQRFYSLDPAPLEEIDEWVCRTRASWTARLDRLEHEVAAGRRALLQKVPITGQNARKVVPHQRGAVHRRESEGTR